MMRAVNDSGRRGRGAGEHDQRPGEALIIGGFSSLGGRGNPYASPRAARRREAARVAAPLAVPVALGVTLGVILAVSAGPTKAHVDQRNFGTTTSSSVSAAPGQKAP
jgi:hypothetical protein